MSMVEVKVGAVCAPVGELTLSVSLPVGLLADADVAEIRLMAAQLAGVLADDLEVLKEGRRLVDRQAVAQRQYR